MWEVVPRRRNDRGLLSVGALEARLVGGRRTVSAYDPAGSTPLDAVETLDVERVLLALVSSAGAVRWREFNEWWGQSIPNARLGVKSALLCLSVYEVWQIPLALSQSMTDFAEHMPFALANNILMYYPVSTSMLCNTIEKACDMNLMNPYNMQPVSSRNIAEVGYLNGTLRVKFHRENRVYEYYDVPERHYRGIMGASSPTDYLNAYIKGYYVYKRVD